MASHAKSRPSNIRIQHSNGTKDNVPPGHVVSTISTLLDQDLGIINSASNSSCDSSTMSPTKCVDGVSVELVVSVQPNLSGSGSPVEELQSVNKNRLRPPVGRRFRTVSGSAEDHVMRTEGKRVVYTAGRPPWYNHQGQILKEPFLIGLCGGSASGKTTVANNIIKALDVPWVTLLSMDSFYKVLSSEQHDRAQKNEYNFDHPDAFDFDLLLETLQKIREGRQVQVPIYNFSTHRREKVTTPMYGADVIIFEGILAFHEEEIVKLMNLKIFVDTDSDTRLARRLRRDTEERGRDIGGVLQQYADHVKPSYDAFIAPSNRCADIIVPRGGENTVAINLIVQRIKSELKERGYNNCLPQNRALLAQNKVNQTIPLDTAQPKTLLVLPTCAQVKGLHTFMRNKETARDEFVFYAKRLMRLLVEFALAQLPFNKVLVTTSQNLQYNGLRASCQGKICGVSILRAGETMEGALREVVKDCKLGKLLIQTNEGTREPELYFLRLPKEIHKYRILLMDATVATGAAAMMAIRILLDHDVPEENISLLSLIMADTGVNSIAYAFPKVSLITTEVDAHLNEKFWILPGVGNFGDRYYGTGNGLGYVDDDSDTDDGRENHEPFDE